MHIKSSKFSAWPLAAGIVLAMAASLLSARGQGSSQMAGAQAQPGSNASPVEEMTLPECLNSAMLNNHRRPASKFAVAMAEAQHRQALAGYWPQLIGKAGYEHLSDSPDFLFLASQMQLPASSAVVSVPGQFFGGPPGSTVQLPVSTPAQTIQVPAQDVKLMDPDVLSASLGVTWLLYDGGMRKGLREQTEGLVEMSKQEARRTDLEITDSVKRYYYGAVLAHQLHTLGDDTLARMETTLRLTETMFKQGAGKVQKTDYLDNKVMVETLRAMVALLEKNEEMAQAALANTMGFSWNTVVRPKDTEVPYAPYNANLERLVSTAYQFSPDWAKVDAGLRAAEGAERTAQSDYYPKLAVTGEIHQWWNNYDAGMATDRDKQGASVGVGLEIPLFSGFLTKNKVAETRAQIGKIKEEQLLFKEGIGLEVRDVFLSLRAAQKSYQATQEAMTAATENRDLNTRAYENELVETEKVVRAQLMEALMSAQHYKTTFDHIALQSQMDLLVGTEVLKKLGITQ